MRIIFVLALLSLAGCQTDWTRLAANDGQELARIDLSLKQPCKSVTAVPHSPTAQQMINGWSTDRAALGDCASRHAGLADAAGILEKQIGANDD